MRTEIPHIAADIKNLISRVSNKLRKSGALVRQSMHEKKKPQSLISDKKFFLEGNNILDSPPRNWKVFTNVNFQS